MTVKEIAGKLDSLEVKMWSLNSLTLAVHDAIVEGPNSADIFEGALHVLTCMTYELEKEVKELTKEVFDTVKSEQKGVV